MEETIGRGNKNRCHRFDSSSEKKNGGSDDQGSYRYGYRSSSAAAAASTAKELASSDSIEEPPAGPPDLDESATMKTDNTDDGASSHPSIGRSLRNGKFPPNLLRAIHDFDDRQFGNLRPKKIDNGGRWLERLGYHVYKQGFPNNLNRLPPVPILQPTPNNNDAVDEAAVSNGDRSLTINVQDVSLELRERDSPKGCNMSRI